MGIRTESQMNILGKNNSRSAKLKIQIKSQKVIKALRALEGPVKSTVGNQQGRGQMCMLGLSWIAHESRCAIETLWSKWVEPLKNVTNQR